MYHMYMQVVTSVFFVLPSADKIAGRKGFSAVSIISRGRGVGNAMGPLPHRASLYRNPFDHGPPQDTGPHCPGIPQYTFKSDHMKHKW